MLAEWDKLNPNRVVNIFKSMQRITPSHLFDTVCFDFKGLSTNDANSITELDTAFDYENNFESSKEIQNVVNLNELLSTKN